MKQNEDAAPESLPTEAMTQAFARVQQDSDLDPGPTPGDLLAWGSQAVLDVAAERRRQIEAEGWTPEHDDEHYSGDLAAAAASYAVAASYVVAPGSPGDPYTADDPPEMWPPEWEFKPGSARSMLVKAGALILAEIERLDRLVAEKKEGE